MRDALSDPISKALLRAIGFCIVAALFPSVIQAGQQDADVIFHNGTVITLEDIGIAQSVAIKDNVILAVGSNADVLAYQNSNTQLIDLNGLTVLPGFVEGHSHILWEKPVSLADAENTAFSFGWTTLNELNTSPDGRFIEFQTAEASGELRMRINAFVAYNSASIDEFGNNDTFEPYFPTNPPVLDNDRLFRVVGIKVFVDGAFSQGRGCWAVTEPFTADFQATATFTDVCQGESRGSLYVEQDTLNQVVAAAQQAGYRVAMHAMGDRAVDVSLNAIEFALNGESNSQYRHQIHHGSYLRPDQLPRYQQLSVPGSVRGTFGSCNPDIWVDVFGSGPHENGANRYALPGLDIHAFAEGDFGWTNDPSHRANVRPINPFINLWGLVTREQLNEDETSCLPDPWISASDISVETGLRMLTLEPAYAVSQENFIGSLRPGKFADLVIVDQDPLSISPDILKDVKVLMTMGNGRVRHCSPGLEALCPVPTANETADDVGSGETRLGPNYPNPFSHSTTIEFYVSGSSPREVELRIVDVLGRTVKTFLKEALAPGEHATVWQGDNDRGAEVANGVYLAQIISGSGQLVQTIIVHR